MIVQKAHSLYERLPVSLQNFAISAYGKYRAERFRYGKFYNVARADLYHLGEATEAELKEFQNQLLRRVLTHAYRHVPFYHSLMKELGLVPADIQQVEDLQKLPILSKEEVRANWHKLQSTVTHGPVMQDATSGTTGKSLRISLSEEVVGYERAVIDRYRARAGFVPGDRIASFNGRELMPADCNEPPFWRMNWAANQMLFSCWHVSEKSLPLYVDAYNEFNPRFVHGYPAFLYLFAEHVLRNGRHVVSPRAIFTSSETLHSWQRQAIEEAFGSRIFDRYGSTERLVSAAQNADGDYLVDSELGVLEIIDGEAVGTSLHNLQMPLIRFRLGDELRFASAEICSKHRRPVIEQPQGRVDDVLIAADGRKFSRLDKIFKLDGVREAQLVQESLERLTMNVVRDRDAPIDERDIHASVSEKLGHAFELTVQSVPEIPRSSSGKFRLIISRVGSERVR